MIEGIYHVRFSSARDHGEGLVVLKDGSLNGGDYGYLYLGKINSTGADFTGKLTIKRWNPAVTSVFGNINQFELEILGSQSPDRQFQAEGKILGQLGTQLKMVGRFLSELE